ncbi:hypothetical protein QE177_14830 (plasmid) [Arsenophonus sp. aPb]|uniref:hypothetical protein n=1 Tax=Arsenophonus sp. aPb TaxID=3041619 RepID=UPI002468B04A|nr:hypothetical protein [Arsenophonus sp. aPb]WGL99786.1 hypothetical protein QE177_14830 [Arsenophonus sp. aPb]
MNSNYVSNDINNFKNTSSDKISRLDHHHNITKRGCFNAIKRVFNNYIDCFGIKKSSNTSPFFRQKVISNKDVRVYICKQIANLKVMKNGMSDKIYASQAIDSILASVYSEQKDKFCINRIKLEKTIPKDYLRDIGQVAKKYGLTGDEKNGIFQPSGIGANSFLNNVMSETQKKFASRMVNREQSMNFRNYAKQKIYDELADLCKVKGRIQPNDFRSKLEIIAIKYCD